MAPFDDRPTLTQLIKVLPIAWEWENVHSRAPLNPSVATRDPLNASVNRSGNVS
jgi:hypothetical protein